MRSVRFVVAGFAVAAVALLAVVALANRTSLAFTLGVAPAKRVVTLAPAQQACQRPVDVPSGGEFDAVSVVVGARDPSPPPLRVVVQSAGGRVLATGRLAGRYGPRAERRVGLDRTVRPGRVSVCLQNIGAGNAAVFGNADLAARTSSAVRDGRPLHRDIALVFERSPRSLASLLPHILDRADLFRIPWLGPWIYVVLAALLLIGAPVLIVRAVEAAAREAPPAAGD
jgi:hypothetical protein